MAKQGYGTRPMWQWVLLYLVIGGVLYYGIYYFFLKGDSGSSLYGDSNSSSLYDGSSSSDSSLYGN